MWDKPQSLNRLSSALAGISLMLILYGALHYIVHLPVFSIRMMELSRVPQRVSVEQIEAVARTEIQGNFFTADLEEIQRSFEKLPWVRKAYVRRSFPWGIKISLEEHEALAHWNDSSLINAYGEVFTPTASSMSWLGQAGQTLPKFYGQLDMAVEIAQMYRVLGERVAPLGWKISQLNLTLRHAWQLRLDNGMVLELGNEQVEQRLERFAAIYPYALSVTQEGNAENISVDSSSRNTKENESRQRVRYVDLRYRNGFAISMRDSAKEVKNET